MKSAETPNKHAAKSAIRSWFNLRLDENQLSTRGQATPYSIILARGNIELLGSACLFSCMCVIAVTALNLSFSGIKPQIILPSLAAMALFLIIALISRQNRKPESYPKDSFFLTFTYCTIWYALALYSDLVLQPYDRSLLTCLVFLVMPLMFDARPRDNLTGSLMAFVVFLALELALIDWPTRAIDITGVGISLIVGLMLSQRKTAARLNEIIYLDMYKTATKTSVLVAQIDMENDTYRTLQAPSSIQAVLSKTPSAKTALKRIGEQFVSPQNREEYDRFFDFDRLSKLLSDTDQASLTYQDHHGLWRLVTVIAHRESDDKITSVVVIVRDVDDERRKEMEYQKKLHNAVTEARRANASKTNFLRRMSHDIRTPINGICGVVEIADHFPNDMDKQAECRQKVKSVTTFLLSLVNNMLDMNKLESGTIDLGHKPFDLMKLSHDVGTIMQTQAIEHNVRIIPSDHGKSLTHRYLIGSPIHLQQILLNLGSNAVKYNRPGGTVSMSCRELFSDENTATYEIAVKDTGLGMSPEFQKHAFDPFAQEERHAVSTYTGSGLGLPIAKELVERMGGTIKLESEEGVGSTFTVTVPFEIDRNHENQAKTEPKSVCLSGKHALLVEDDDLNAEIAEFILSKEGLSLQRVSNGQEAVDAFAASGPLEFDLVFMDVMMPVMNGLDATRAIRALNRPDATTVPILAMTANAFYDDEQESLKAGMNAHLTKPLEVDKIRETIAQVLA